MTSRRPNHALERIWPLRSCCNRTPFWKQAHKVIFDGKALQFPHGSETDGLEQAKQQASRLSKWLSEATGEPVRATAILTLPGWWVESRVNSEAKAMNPGHIRGFVRGCKQCVSAEQLKRIVHQLDQRCRDVEL